MSQLKLFNIPEKQNENDVVYTPQWVAQDMINFFKPSGKCLDPCYGTGAFYNLLPDGSDYCEIKQGKDFYDYYKKVDWIIGNPPYSDWMNWVIHSFKLSKNILYLITTNKFFISYKIIKKLRNWGHIKHIRYYGPGNRLGFPLGFAIGAVYIKKNYFGPMEISYYEN